MQPPLRKRTVPPFSAMPITVPPPPPKTSRQPRWRRRSGVKERANLCQAHRDLLQGTGAKTEPFYLHIGALLPNPR